MTSEFGKLVWECPALQPASAKTHKIVGIAMIAGALLIGLMLLQFSWTLLRAQANLAKGGPRGLSEVSDTGGGANIQTILLLASALPVILLIAGIWVLLSGLFPKKPLGVFFLERAIVLGPANKRRTIRYNELEYLYFEPLTGVATANRQADAVAAFVAGAMTLNPHWIGYSIGKHYFDKVRGIVRFRPLGEAEIKLPVFDDGVMAMQSLHNHFARRGGLNVS